MPTETTATMLIGQLQPFMSTPSVFRAQHLLLLEEGFRATWRIIPLDGTDHADQTFGRPNGPQHLLAHGLLAYMAASAPDLLAGGSPLARLISKSSRGAGWSTNVPDEASAGHIARALPRLTQVVLTVLPGSSVHPLDAADLIAAEVRIITSAGEAVPA